jgi:A/G-specific adenine glycosylase
VPEGERLSFKQWTSFETALESPLTLSSRARTQLRQSLRAWYQRQARDLPWRRTRDPYRILVSELMLQQTRVDTVIHYYQRFLAEFPNIRRLADASLDQVLTLWSGLGYYRRARNLHAAAQLVRDRMHGRLPSSAEGLRRLPGVGRYTAAAVASIAFDEPAAVLDGNVKRVLARLAAFEEAIDTDESTRRLWRAADELLARRHPGDHNQAMMELGATICLPRQPKCDVCPIRRCCRANATGRQERLPIRRPRAASVHLEVIAGAIEHRGCTLLVKRPDTGLLAGMWQLPDVAARADCGRRELLKAHLRERLGLECEVSAGAGTVDHVFTHRTMRIEVFRCRRVGGRARCSGEQTRWVRPTDLAGLPLARVDRKVLGLLFDEPSRGPTRAAAASRS